jgi:hypothetical protein
MHKLVHAWGYDRLCQEEQHDVSSIVLQLLAEAISECGKEPQDRLRLIPHLMANFATVANARYGRPSPTGTTLYRLEKIGAFISSVGKWVEACTIRKFLVHKLGELLGEEHPDTISVINNLAVTLRNQGQLDEAARMMKEVLEKRSEGASSSRRATGRWQSNSHIRISWKCRRWTKKWLRGCCRNV